MKELSLKASIQGNKQGESLIVIHGWAMHSAVWDTVKTTLEAKYKVTWVDLPGHGINSDVTAGSLERIVDLVLPFLTVKSHLMGWSLGGLVVQALADRNPEMIKSITLVASTPRFSQTENWPHAMSNEVLVNFANNLQKDSKGTIKRFIGLQFMGIKNTNEVQRGLLESVLSYQPNKEALQTGLNILSSADFRKARHKMPQHWILAERDRLIPKSMINDLNLIHPDAQITLLKNAGHAPFMTHAEEFMDSFTSFMKNLVK